ncbi:uncharacterized protein LOC112531761 isoform X1 [Gallus gallus]|uniref:uncharacterized protein LOC112531761 isoform X1 n=1 Tax=Gallus gallus TaxID=9031 RepID=UPI001AE5B147|nr:uncharacterized protein LOC112531761 isoform X1 [Gallus gallus]
MISGSSLRLLPGDLHMWGSSSLFCPCARQGSTLRPAPPRPVLMRRSLLTLAGVILHQMRRSQMQGRAKYKMQILRKGTRLALANGAETPDAAFGCPSTPETWSTPTFSMEHCLQGVWRPCGPDGRRYLVLTLKNLAHKCLQSV